MNYIVGLALGMSNYLSTLLPFGFLHPIPLIAFVSLFTLPFYFFKTRPQIPRVLTGLLIFGTIVAVVRYFLFYQGQFQTLPILRQATSFTLGIMLLMFFRHFFAKFKILEIAEGILSCSLIFLFYGLYQKITDQIIVGHYRIKGLFQEPSYYGEYLVLILIPFLFYSILNFKRLDRLMKVITLLALILTTLNIVYVQSGTAILKIISFVFIGFIFFPTKLKYKAAVSLLTICSIAVLVWMNPGYVHQIILQSCAIIKNPELFMMNHTFYDRFYPIWAAVKNFFSFAGIIGLGFAGDYFEFHKLFPPSTYTEMMIHKPMFSFFNSFASKIILYFGVLGIVFLGLLFKKSGKIKNPVVKIGYLNVLISSLWGVSSFTLPYIWFWLALAEREDID